MEGKDLKPLLTALDESLSNVARKLGMTPQGLDNLLRTKDIKTGIIEKLSMIYNKPISYFLEGYKSKNDFQSNKNIDKSKRIFAVSSSDDEVSMIPVLPIDALASFISNPSMVESSEIDYDPVVLNSQEKRDIKNLCVINVHGDSMSPVINNHARVLAKRVPRPQWGNVGGIVGVSYNDTTDGFSDPYFVVKNVGSNKLFSENYIILESENKDYGNMKVQLADILAMWECLRIVSQSLR